MPAIFIPHIDPHKQGATEHVEAIIRTLREQEPDAIIADAVTNHYTQDEAGKNLPLDLTDQIRTVKNNYDAKYGSNARYVVVTGDYGADTTTQGGSAASDFKSILGEKTTKIVLSSYTAESKPIVDAFYKGEVDRLVLPEAAIEPAVLQGVYGGNGLLQNENRIIKTLSVPHTMTEASLHEKHAAWNQAATEGKVATLPESNDATRKYVAVVIPGDVENSAGKPKFFTAHDAVKLAEAVYARAATDTETPPLFMVSNGPRTGKYNEQLKENDDFNPHNPVFHNSPYARL